MPVVVIVVIVSLVVWLALAGRRPDDRLAQARADHPSGSQSSSVHIIQLGEPHD